MVYQNEETIIVDGISDVNTEWLTISGYSHDIQVLEVLKYVVKNCKNLAKISLNNEEGSSSAIKGINIEELKSNRIYELGVVF